MNCPTPSNCISTDPRERYDRVYHPLAQLLFSPNVVNNLQIALDGNSGEVDQRTEEWTQGKCLAQHRHAEYISASSVEWDVAKFDYLRREQKEAADEIEQILVEYQRLLLVLFRGHHGVQDKSVGCRSYESDNYDSALKIETDTT